MISGGVFHDNSSVDSAYLSDPQHRSTPLSGDASLGSLPPYSSLSSPYVTIRRSQRLTKSNGNIYVDVDMTPHLAQVQQKLNFEESPELSLPEVPLRFVGDDEHEADTLGKMTNLYETTTVTTMRSSDGDFQQWALNRVEKTHGTGLAQIIADYFGEARSLSGSLTSTGTFFTAKSIAPRQVEQIAVSKFASYLFPSRADAVPLKSKYARRSIWRDEWVPPIRRKSMCNRLATAAKWAWIVMGMIFALACCVMFATMRKNLAIGYNDQTTTMALWHEKQESPDPEMECRNPASISVCTQTPRDGFCYPPLHRLPTTPHRIWKHPDTTFLKKNESLVPELHWIAGIPSDKSTNANVTYP